MVRAAATASKGHSVDISAIPAFVAKNSAAAKTPIAADTIPNAFPILLITLSVSSLKAMPNPSAIFFIILITPLPKSENFWKPADTSLIPFAVSV